MAGLSKPRNTREKQHRINMSELEDVLDFQIKVAKIKEPVREYRFSPYRRWRFDFAWIEIKLAVEVEGGIWNGGRHLRPTGFKGDIEKYNNAALLGWTILRVTSDMIKSGEALKLIESVLLK